MTVGAVGVGGARLQMLCAILGSSLCWRSDEVGVEPWGAGFSFWRSGAASLDERLTNLFMVSVRATPSGPTILNKCTSHERPKRGRKASLKTPDFYSHKVNMFAATRQPGMLTRISSFGSRCLARTLVTTFHGASRLTSLSPV